MGGFLCWQIRIVHPSKYLASPLFSPAQLSERKSPSSGRNSIEFTKPYHAFLIVFIQIPEREENTADEQGGSNAEEEELDEDEAMEREHKELESLGQKEANKFGDSENNQEEKEDKEKQEVVSKSRALSHCSLQ